MTGLAALLLLGLDGVEKYVERAVCLYERAIEEGADVDWMPIMGIRLMCDMSGF